MSCVRPQHPNAALHARQRRRMVVLLVEQHWGCRCPDCKLTPVSVWGSAATTVGLPVGPGDRARIDEPERSGGSVPTYSPKASEIERDWHVVDADGAVLGRLASEVAQILRGKHKPNFTPFLKTGDFVIVVNASKVCLTGNKETAKVYWRHSGYPGGLRKESVREVRAKYPERLVQRAVAGMLPKNKLGRQLTTRLKVYSGADHPHQAQQPKPWAI